MEKFSKYIVAFMAFAIFGGLVAWGLFAAKDKFVAWNEQRVAEEKEQAAKQQLLDEQVATTSEKCKELCSEVVKYIEANKEDDKLKQDDAQTALQFIVADERDPWGNQYILAIDAESVIVSSPGPSDSASDDVQASAKIKLPEKSMWQKVQGFFK